MRTLLTALLGLLCCSAAVAAAAAPSPLDSLWCRYGLGGCGTAPNATHVHTAVVGPPVPGNVTVQDDGGAATTPAAPEPTTVPKRLPVDGTFEHHAAMEPSSAAATDDVSTHAGTADRAAGPAVLSPAPLPLTTAEASSAEVPAEAPPADVDGRSSTEGGAGMELAEMVAQAADARAGTTALVAMASTGGEGASGGAAPLWALLLLGGSVAAAAAVQLWHCLPHRGVLCRTASAQRSAQPAAAELKQGARALGGCRSVDVEVAAGRPVPSAASQAAQLQEEHVEKAAAAELSPPGSPSSSAADDSPSPSSSGAATAPQLGVDPSVRCRDISQRGWVPSQPGQQRRASQFENPLFVPGAPLVGTAGEQEQAGSARPVAAGWQAKQAAAAGACLDRGGSQAADFRLLAAAQLAEPAGEASQEGTAHTAFVAASRRTASSDLSPPASPGKRAAGAARKLTGARSVGPQALSPGAEGAAGGQDAAGKHAATPQPEKAAASLQGTSTTTLHSSPAAPSSLAAASGIAGQLLCPALPALQGARLLTPQQLQEGVRLGKMLGAGATACVYAAEWEGRQVAVKVPHPFAADPNAFAREVGMMAALGRHPHIIGLLGACLQEPLALVQELAATSLHSQLHEGGLRPQYGLLMLLAEDVASALEHCHAQRPPLVHRDLSARNVLLGADGRARLADFGLAAAKARTYGGVLGTAAYMAPETMAAGPVCERCDSFSFGVLLWEMLTGRVAWEELEPLQVMFAVGVERRRLPIPPGCPPALAKLLKECWRHNAPLRPSFREIVQRLRQLQSQDRFKTARLPVAPAAQLHAAGRAKPYTAVAVLAAPTRAAAPRGMTGVSD